MIYSNGDVDDSISTSTHQQFESLAGSTFDDFNTVSTLSAVPWIFGSSSIYTRHNAPRCVSSDGWPNTHLTALGYMTVSNMSIHSVHRPRAYLTPSAHLGWTQLVLRSISDDTSLPFHQSRLAIRLSWVYFFVCASLRKGIRLGREWGGMQRIRRRCQQLQELESNSKGSHQCLHKCVWWVTT